VPPHKGPLRRIEQLRRELQQAGKLSPDEPEDEAPEPLWRSGSKTARPTT
jgi:hypothetical protein